MQHEDLTSQIIGCAFKVHNSMGFGFLESVYERCLLLELKRAGLRADAQYPLRVYYDEEPVGDFLVDILVEGEVLIELKSVRTLQVEHEVQLVNYLTATRKDVGLLINFGADKVQVKRKQRLLPTE